MEFSGNSVKKNCIKEQSIYQRMNSFQIGQPSNRNSIAIIKMKNDVRKTINVGGGFGINMADIESFNVENNIQQLEYQGDSESNLLSQRLTLANPLMLEQEQKLEIEEDLKQNYIQKVPTWISFLILAYFALNGSFVPPWILTIPAEKYLRVAWRFFMQGMLLLPFVMWEYRQKKGSNIYTFSYIFTMERIKKAYLSSFANSLWFTIACFGFEWTYVSYSITLSSLQLFFLSIKRKKEESHNYEYPGRIMVIIGIILIFIDSFTFSKDDVNPSAHTYRVTKYIHRSLFQRVVLGNCGALVNSYLQSKFVQNNSLTNQYYPPHLRMFIICMFNVLNMSFSSYFFSGSDIISSQGSFWSWFGLFSSDQFSTYLFISIILGLGSFISSIYVAKVFEPLDIQTAQSFEPTMATMLAYLMNVQHLPGGLGCIAQAFIVPGNFFINLGQYMYTQNQVQKNEQMYNKQNYFKQSVFTRNDKTYDVQKEK